MYRTGDTEERIEGMNNASYCVRPAICLKMDSSLYRPGNVTWNLGDSSFKAESRLWNDFNNYFGGQKLPTAINMMEQSGKEFKGWKRCLRIATNYSNILQMYEISEVIGVGSFSSVKLATNKVTNQKVAVKIITKNKLSSPMLETTLTESEIIKICQVPYIIKFIEAYENIEFIYIFMEYCPGGTLFNFLKKRNY